MRNTVLLKCNRTRSESWKLDDVEKHFDFVKNPEGLDEKVVANAPSAKVKGFEWFVIKPFRFGGKKTFESAVYYELYGSERNSGPFVSYTYLGIITPKKPISRMY